MDDDVRELRRTFDEVRHGLRELGGDLGELSEDSPLMRSARRSRNIGQVASIVCIGILLIGEALALRVLAYEEPSDARAVIVGVCLALGASRGLSRG